MVKPDIFIQIQAVLSVLLLNIFSVVHFLFVFIWITSWLHLWSITTMCGDFFRKTNRVWSACFIHSVKSCLEWLSCKDHILLKICCAWAQKYRTTPCLEKGILTKKITGELNSFEHLLWLTVNIYTDKKYTVSKFMKNKGGVLAKQMVTFCTLG